MNALFYKSWWALALRGVLGILFGALAILWPGLTFMALIILFAAYAFFSGVGSIVAAVRHRRSDEEWWLILLLGIVGVSAGIVALLRPDITALALVFFVGAYAMLTGVLDIAIAIRLRRSIPGERLLIVTGVVSIAFGVLVFLFPDAGALALVWLISVYAIATGTMLLILGLRVRRWTEPVENRRLRTRRRGDNDTPLHNTRVRA